MPPKTFLKIFLATLGIGSVALVPHVFAQSQIMQTVHQQPESVYTYHGQIIAAPPQSELAPVASTSVTSTELVVKHTPSVAYPDGDITEPVALEGDTAMHEASLVTTRKTYDGNGKLVDAERVDHLNDAQ